MKNEKIKLALVGCGGIVAAAHAPALKQLADRYEVTAVCDPVRPAAEKLARFLGLPDSAVHTAIEAVAAARDVEAALVSVPHHQHRAATSILLGAGKHVLVEKPFALNLAEATELVRQADAARVQLVVGHCQRHCPLGLAAKEMIAAGQLGRLFFAQATALQYLPMYVPPESGHWLYSAEQAGGGIVISVGVHKLDLLRFLLGDVARVTALFETDAARASATRPFEWTAGVNLQFQSGAIGSVALCYKAYSHTWEQETLCLLGEEGSLRAKGLEEFEAISRQLPAWARQFVNHRPKAASEWVTQLIAFHDTVANGTPNRADAHDALKTMALLDAIYASGTAGGTPVVPAL